MAVKNNLGAYMLDSHAQSCRLSLLYFPTYCPNLASFGTRDIFEVRSRSSEISPIKSLGTDTVSVKVVSKLTDLLRIVFSSP